MGAAAILGILSFIEFVMSIGGNASHTPIPNGNLHLDSFQLNTAKAPTHSHDCVVSQDGTGDYSGSDQTPIINCLARFNNTAGPGSVHIEKGTYFLTKNIAVYNVSNLEILGDGMATHIIQTNSSQDIFDVNGKNSGINSNIQIKGLWLDTLLYNARATISMSNVTNSTVESVKLDGGNQIFNLYFAGPTAAVDSDIPYGTLDSGNKVLNSQIYGNYYGDMLSWSFQKNGIISNNVISGARVAVYEGVNNILSNNTIANTSNEGLWITGTTYQTKLVNNTIENTSLEAIKLTGANYGCDIASNLIYKAGSMFAGALVFSSILSFRPAAEDSCTIASNTFKDTPGGAIAFDTNGTYHVTDNAIDSVNTQNRQWFNGGSAVLISGGTNQTIFMDGNRLYDDMSSGSSNSVFTVSDEGNKPTARIYLSNNILNNTDSLRGSDHPIIGNRAFFGANGLAQLLSMYASDYQLKNNWFFTNSNMNLTLYTQNGNPAS